MTDAKGFELVLKKSEMRETSLGTVAGTLTFETSMQDKAAWDELQALTKAKPLRLHVYGSFEDEIASVLREDRDRWKRTSEAQTLRIAYLERELAQKPTR